MKDIIGKAAVLIEALPYIQRFRGAVVTVKFGGSAMEYKPQHDGILQDIVFMECVGMLPVIVHGGGKAISQRMKAAGLAPQFVRGLRVTDAATVTVVERVLSREVNPEIVATIERFGGRAEPLDGRDLFGVDQLEDVDAVSGERLNWGFVGVIRETCADPIRAVLARGAIPVITPLGRGRDGRTYNLNADDAAAAVARALPARKLAFVSDVPGLLRERDDPNSLISTVKVGDVSDLVARRVIDGGMLPKMRSAVEAIAAGVVKVHLVDGRTTHSLLLEMFTDKGIGTEIIA